MEFLITLDKARCIKWRVTNVYDPSSPSEKVDFDTWLYNLICFLLIIGLFLYSLISFGRLLTVTSLVGVQVT